MHCCVKLHTTWHLQSHPCLSRIRTPYAFAEMFADMLSAHRTPQPRTVHLHTRVCPRSPMRLTSYRKTPSAASP